MILVIDFDNTKRDILLAADGAVRRFSSPKGGGFRGLGDVLEVMRKEGHESADGVAVVLPIGGERAKEKESERARKSMSWSTVREAVALANALAFAWNVPAVRIDGAKCGKTREDRAKRNCLTPYDCSDEDLRESAKAALEGAASDARVSATYDGEPNITKPKSDS